MKDLTLHYLENIGLTKSEIKVYAALLEIGESSKGEIVRKAKIAASKVYDILDKLMNKGLASVVIKNNIRYFRAANPLRIKDYVNKKKEELIQQEKSLDKIMPELRLLYETKEEESIIQVFKGWKGMETVYSSLISQAKKNDTISVLGAGTGIKELQLELFFTKYRKIALKKGMKTRIIFNINAKKYVASMEKNVGKIEEKRFLFQHTPSEIVISKNDVIILIRRSEPIIIHMKDKETAKSFLDYFSELWKIAQK